MDFPSLREQAAAHERKYGRDLGNGWAIRHPLAKLELFQQFCRDCNLHKASE